MFLFAVCLVFGAHPDFWLSDAEFEAKYCKAAIDDLNQWNEVIADSRQIAAAGKQNLSAEYFDGLQKHLIKKVTRLDKDRVTKRTRLLINRQRR